MVQVCEGIKTKNDMVIEAVEQYKDIFIKARRNFEKVVSVRCHFEVVSESGC
jgi:DNA topoisomerase-3